MNHNITDDYCSLEVSKLLKAKGFVTYCTYSFWKGEFINETPGYPLEDRRTSQENYHKFERYYSPTHAIAIKWLRENFGIYIEVYMTRKEKFSWLSNKHNSGVDVFPTPEDATEDALFFTLCNLD